MGNKTENTTEKSRRGDETAPVEKTGPLFKILASRWASALILAAIASIFIGTSLFGAGSLSSLAGERLVILPGSPSLPVFFSTQIIKMLSLALYLTLIAGVYAIVRESGSLKKGLGGFAPTHTISLTQNPDEAAAEARRALTEELGLREKGERGGWVVLEKGLPYKVLLWVYYAGIALFLASAAISNISAFDRSVTLTRGLPAEIEATETSKLRLTAGPLTVRHTGIRTSANPAGLTARLARTVKGQGPAYEVMDSKLYPLDWSLKVGVQENGGKTIEKTIGSDGPLKHGGLAFRLKSIEQTFRLRVEDNPLVLSAGSGEELIIPGIGPGLGLPVRFTPFMGGVLERSDGSIEEITPHTRLKLSGTDGEELGSLEPGKSIYINGVRLTLLDVKEESVLGYSYNPGLPLLVLASIVILISAALRIFGFWQTAAYRIDSSSQIVRLQLHIKSRGLFASSERLCSRITSIMTAEDIRPIPIPGERLK